MSLTDDTRRHEAEARRQAIALCRLCDDHGWITGHQTGHDGVTRDAAWKCGHTDQPLPAGFTPDPKDHR